MRRYFLSPGPRPARTRSLRAAFPLGVLAVVLGLAAVPARAHALQVPATQDAAIAAPAAPAPVDDRGSEPAGPRLIGPVGQAGTVAPPTLDAAIVPALADGEAMWRLSRRETSRGQFFLVLVGLVAVGAGTYKLGETLEVEALQSAGGFIAGAGLLGIIIPIWLFF